MGYEMFSQESIAERKILYAHEYNNREGSPYVCMFGQFADAVFVSPDGSAAMTVSATPFNVNLRTLTSKEIHRDLQAHFAHEQHMASMSTSTSGFTYTVAPRRITDETTYLARSGFEIKQAQATIPCEMFLYCVSTSDASYAVRLAVVSDGAVFEENLINLEHMAATLKRYEPPAPAK
jgi:hypothetical protein